MGEEDGDPVSDVSTVNLGATIVADHQLKKWADHERMMVVRDVGVRDLGVLINRINDEYGAVTGTTKVRDPEVTEGGVYIIYFDKR